MRLFVRSHRPFELVWHANPQHQKGRAKKRESQASLKTTKLYYLFRIASEIPRTKLKRHFLYIRPTVRFLHGNLADLTTIWKRQEGPALIMSGLAPREEAVLDSIIDRLLDVSGIRQGKQVQLLEGEIQWLCLTARKVFMEQPVLLDLDTPIRIIGDIHGQYLDLLRFFERGGFPPDSNYLFLGDYVDRGKQSLETICLLFAYKIKYPDNFFLLRGNHECASISRIYGFFDECKRRYNIKLWKTFTDTFNCLPIAAIVDEKIFCVHGGLSPHLKSLTQIDRIIRPIDIPDHGLPCDLLWSDPSAHISGWSPNDRGVSYTFGSDVVAKFLAKHDLDLICRSHQVVEDGYEFFDKRKLITLFSAPNYCDMFDNSAAMMKVDEGLVCSFVMLKAARSEGVRRLGD